MRKVTFALVVLCLCLLAAVPGLCQAVNLDSIYATLEIPDSYTILTEANMETHVDFLNTKGVTVDVMLQTFQAEGILLQAYGKNGDTRLQITALKDVDAQTYFDIDQHTPATRAKYRREHLDGEAYEALGISYDSAEWKKTTAYGRFLMLKYVQRLGGKVDHRGFARRTIRNGYTITLDYQVYGRGLNGKDNNAINDIMDTWRFTKVLAMPGSAGEAAAAGETPAALATTQLTQEPPTQTNKSSFVIKGTTTPGASITGSIYRMGDEKPELVKGTAGKTGSFTLDFNMPREGVYVLVLTVTVNGIDIDELQLPGITYDKTLLPVRFDETFPEDITTDKLLISGTTDPATQITCVVNGKTTKKKANAKGAFSFSINTAEEGEYSFEITLSKKGLSDRHFTFTASRVWSETELREKVSKDAIKPAYSILTSKINGYTGRVMGYTAYVTEISKSSDTWYIHMALRKVNSIYREKIVVLTKNEPTVMIDSQMKMYGRCLGMHVEQNNTGEEEYPSFELLFWGE